MTDYEMNQYADQKIDQMLNEIDCNQLRKLFDDPIDAVFGEMEVCFDPPIDSHTFNEIIAGVIEKIYTSALHKILPNPDYLTEAIELLDAFYQGLYADGYIAALMDANDREKGGICHVLSALVEAVKLQTRNAYIQSVFAAVYGASDWILQQKITENLLNRYASFLPPSIKHIMPARICSQAPVLLRCYALCRYSFESLSSGVF